MTDPTLASLINDSGPLTIFRTIAGSHAYGTATAESDEDIRGIYGMPLHAYAGLKQAAPQVADESNDTIFYSVRRVLELAASANPNVLELFYMPEACIQRTSTVMALIQSRRDLFITRQCLSTHIGYAQAQIKKAKGRNKWVNNPQPEEPPARADFCWVLLGPWPGSSHSQPLRPVPLATSGIDLSACHCSSLEHCPDIYRLYEVGPGARGVLRGDNVVCESIPLALEQSCIGLLIDNRQGWERAMRDHKHYWQWRRQRNDARWRTQESGEMDYDAKNMMHTFRLLMSGEHILHSGQPRVRFEGEDLTFLRRIREGHFGYSELIDHAADRIAVIEKATRNCDLPETCDLTTADALFLESTKLWETTCHDVRD